MPTAKKRPPTLYQKLVKASSGRCAGTVSASDHKKAVAAYKTDGLKKATTAARKKKVEQIAKKATEKPCTIGIGAARKKRTTKAKTAAKPKKY